MEQTDFVTDTSQTKTTLPAHTDANVTDNFLLEKEIEPDTPIQHPTAVEQATPATAPADTETLNDVHDDTASTATSQKAQPENEARPSSDIATILVGFKDFAFDPIEGLKYKFELDGKTIKTGTTNSTCNTVTLTEVTPGSEIQILVFREHTKDFKNIGSIYAHPGNSSYAICSPKLKYVLETEEHAGAPGDAAQKKPSVPEKSGEQKLDSSSTPSTSLPVTPSTQTISVTPPPAPSPGENKAVLSPIQAKAKTQIGQQQKQNIAHARDSVGHPQANVENTALDWLKRKILSVFNFWSWHDFQASAPKPPVRAKPGKTKMQNKGTKTEATALHSTAPAQPVQGHPKINPPSPATRYTPGEKLSTTDLQRLHTLIEFAENQVKFDYIEYKGKGGTTVNVLAEYARTESPSFKPKEPYKSLGLCQVYVKVALFKAGYTNGPGWEAQAKTSGKDWLKYGFTNVSSTLPHVEITYEKENVKYVQPDVMYTLPGDVIVYEQVSPLENDPAGHVDIRTYHGFVSDFAWMMTPALGGRPQKKRYRVTGVFRKISDTMAMARVQAFLRIIREHEAKGYKQPYKALRRQNGKEVNFVSFDTHPGSNEERELVAGAYQIMWGTWNGVITATGWPRVFTPEMQDRIALYLLHDRPLPTLRGPYPRRTALGYLMEGKVEEAINETKLWNLWACLPGGNKQQQLTMSELTTKLNGYIEEFTA